MTRVTIVQPDLSGPPLGELEEWLGLSPDTASVQERATLSALLSASFDMCEAFTAALPLVGEFEEILPAHTKWQELSTRPVQAITAVEGIPAEGPRYLMPVADYAVDLRADGTGSIRILRQGSAGRVAVRFTAGRVPDWASLPGALKHGILRLAAHYYRSRDLTDNAAPPAAIAALWRPYRRMRLT